MLNNEKALFLGPFGENKDEFQRWVRHIIEDITGWRNNYHPEDPRAIQASEKREKAYYELHDRLEQNLNRMLADMKQSVPIHSPRYLGHMLSDVLMPALLGYYTGLIYNQNNVVGEVATATTRKEIEFCREMCEMIGYEEMKLDTGGSWGHLTSGGSTAILEGVWTARNIKYFPLTVKLLLENDNDVILQNINNIEITQPNGDRKKFSDFTIQELFDLDPEAMADFKDTVFKSILNSVTTKNENNAINVNKLKKKANTLFEKKISPFLVQHLGVFGIHQQIKEKWGIELPLPKLYVSQTAHYSWEKAMDILGIGKANVVKVKSDKDFRLDIDDLKVQLNKNNDAGILLVVGVVGTTEESAVDPINKIVQIKEEWKKDKNKSFYLKIDGAWGGYYLSMIRERNRNDEKDKAVKEYFSKNKNFYKSIMEDLDAVKNADSIVIDPHKMGYVPYAVGSVCYKDTRYKEFIYKSAPYLDESDEENYWERTYLGGWTIEGSRSGAAALACWLSAKVLPLRQDGYGKLILDTFIEADKLYNELSKANGDISLISVYKPQGNIVCYLAAAPGYIQDPVYLNKLNKYIYDELSVLPKHPLPDFVVSKTELNYEKYEMVIKDLFKKAGIAMDKLNDKIENDEDYEFDELLFLRTVTMNPMLKDYKVEKRTGNVIEYQDIYTTFLEKIQHTGQKALTTILLDIIKKKNKGKRIKILWIENKESFENLQKQLKTDLLKGLPPIGKYIDIVFDDYKGGNPLEQIKNIIKDKQFDFAVIDMNLTDNDHVEWDSGFAVIDKLYGIENPIIAKPIIFSQFLDNDETANALKNKLRNDYPGIFENEHQFLAKNTSNIKEEDAIKELVKRIFLLMQ